MNTTKLHIPTKKGARIALHFLFWLGSLGFFWLLFSRSNGDKLNSALFIAFLSPISIFITYFLNYRLIPRFLITGEYFKFGWYTAIVSITGLWLSLLGGIYIFMWRANCNLGSINKQTIDVTMLVAALFFVVLMGVAAKLIRINFQVQKQKDEAVKSRLLLDNQLKEAELKLLKEQLNPHFLFNTLNNIYGLTLEKSDKAPDLVMRLSNILDYMLYRTDTEKVALEQEIHMIENYVSIEQHRFEGRHPISFNVEGNCNHLTIAPFLFLPLVENCFKHGIRNSVNGSFVKIDLQVDAKVVTFTTRNFADRKSVSSKGGIGLPNLKKRLAMLYPETHTLNLSSANKEFVATLTIHLNDI